MSRYRPHRWWCATCEKWSHTDGFAAAIRSSAMFGVPFRTYECPAGNGSHLTTKPKKEKSRGEAAA